MVHFYALFLCVGVLLRGLSHEKSGYHKVLAFFSYTDNKVENAYHSTSIAESAGLPLCEAMQYKKAALSAIRRREQPVFLFYSMFPGYSANLFFPGAKTRIILLLDLYLAVGGFLYLFIERSVNDVNKESDDQQNEDIGNNKDDGEQNAYIGYLSEKAEDKEGNE